MQFYLDVNLPWQLHSLEEHTQELINFSSKNHVFVWAVEVENTKEDDNEEDNGIEKDKPVHCFVKGGSCEVKLLSEFVDYIVNFSKGWLYCCDQQFHLPYFPQNRKGYHSLPTSVVIFSIY